MTVYVDDMHLSKMGEFKSGGRTYKMCHLIADTDAELHAMADRIGVERRHFQQPPKVATHQRHYDIAMSKRVLAVAAGSVEITMRQSAALCRCRQYTGELGSVADVFERRAALIAAARAKRAEAVS